MLLEENNYDLVINLKKTNDMTLDKLRSFKELYEKYQQKDSEEDKNKTSFTFNKTPIDANIEHININFKSFAGKTFIDLFYRDEELLKIPIEVRSKKIDYQEQYPQMIADIAEYLSGLLFRMSSPLYHSYELHEVSNTSPYEEYMLLEYLFRPDNLPSIFEYLSRNLYSQLEEYTERVPTTFASNIGSNELSNIAAYTDDVEERSLDESIFSVDGTHYIPLEIDEIQHLDIIDVPENRFYKYFLEYIEERIYKLLENKALKDKENSVRRDLEIYKNEIEYFLSQKYFNDISRLDYLPLNSQVLQKKEGYRELLQYFLMFELGLKIDCSAITDEFKGYEKKLYELYEYWCYFQLASILEELYDFNFNLDDFADEETFTLNLKANPNQRITVKDKEIDITLKYQSVFKEFDSGNRGYKSRSLEMKPDYTIFIKYDDIENFIHFDAKYKIIYNNDKESYNPDDIRKMHTYNDAIKDTIGSYVLYPGSNKGEFPDDGKPQVGAFPLNPKFNESEKEDIKELINEKLNEFVERVKALEKEEKEKEEQLPMEKEEQELEE